MELADRLEIQILLLIYMGQSSSKLAGQLDMKINSNKPFGVRVGVDGEFPMQLHSANDRGADDLPIEMVQCVAANKNISLTRRYIYLPPKMSAFGAIRISVGEL